MLAQAQVHLERVKVGTGEAAGLPFAQETFDLITCTNALHDLPEPVGTLSGLRRLLSPGGQLVVGDFARRERPFPWAAFAWLLHQIDGSHLHASLHPNFFSTLLSNTALVATVIELALMAKAPTSGLSRIPKG